MQKICIFAEERLTGRTGRTGRTGGTGRAGKAGTNIIG